MLVHLVFNEKIKISIIISGFFSKSDDIKQPIKFVEGCLPNIKLFPHFFIIFA